MRKLRRVVTGEDSPVASYVLQDAPVSFADARSVHWFTERTADALRDAPDAALSSLPLNPPIGATSRSNV